jgi:hypothetical protein
MKAVFVKARKGRPGGIYAIKGTKAEIAAYEDMQGENLRVAKGINGVADGTPLLFDSTLVLGTQAEYDVELVELRDGTERYLVQNPDEAHLLALLDQHTGDAGRASLAGKLLDGISFNGARKSVITNKDDKEDPADSDPEEKAAPAKASKASLNKA